MVKRESKESCKPITFDYDFSMKIRTSVTLSPENMALADSIAEAEERSRSFVLDKAIQNGLEKMDSPAAKAIRAKKPKK